MPSAQTGGAEFPLMANLLQLMMGPQSDAPTVPTAAPGTSTGTTPTAGGANAPRGRQANSADVLRALDWGDLTKGQGGEGAGPNASGGQPGSAGSGAAKSAVDALIGLAAGEIAPGFGVALTAARALTDPNFSLSSVIDPFGFLGINSQTGFQGTVTDPKEISNMATNPSAYGLTNAAVSTTGQMTSSQSPAQTAAQQAALDAATPGADFSGQTPGTGKDASGGQGQAGPGGWGSNVGGAFSGDAASIGAYGGADASGDSGGYGGSGGNDAGGFTSKGGPIKGPAPKGKDKDNLQVSETGQGLQAGEHIMSRAAVKMVGRKKLDQINQIAELREKAMEFVKMAQKVGIAQKAA